MAALGRIVERGHRVVLRIVGDFVHDERERLVASVHVAVDGDHALGHFALFGRDLNVRARLVLDLVYRGAALADEQARRRVGYEELDLVDAVLQFVVTRALFRKMTAINFLIIVSVYKDRDNSFGASNLGLNHTRS